MASQALVALGQSFSALISSFKNCRPNILQILSTLLTNKFSWTWVLHMHNGTITIFLVHSLGICKLMVHAISKTKNYVCMAFKPLHFQLPDIFVCWILSRTACEQEDTKTVKMCLAKGK